MACLRRELRNMIAIPLKPISIDAQVAGSGMVRTVSEKGCPAASGPTKSSTS
jgi:hypothetical protein